MAEITFLILTAILLYGLFRRNPYRTGGLQFWLKVFGVVLLARPRPAAAAVTWLVGLFALIMGVLWLILAFRARNWPQA